MRPAQPAGADAPACPQDWLAVVLAATAAAPRNSSWGSGCDGHDAAVRRFRGGVLGDRVATPRLVKVVVSATVTRDPSKLEQLQLHSPLLLSATPSDERCACCQLAAINPPSRLTQACAVTQVPVPSPAGAVPGGGPCRPEAVRTHRPAAVCARLVGVGLRSVGALASSSLIAHQKADTTPAFAR
jgi:hypothetical protein